MVQYIAFSNRRVGEIMAFKCKQTAYLLQIHNHPEQVNKFISQLIVDNQAVVFVHVDRKYYQDIAQKIIKHPNVRVLEQSIDCEWGDISQVDTTILLLKEMLASQKQYDYVCLRSGQDLLVREGFTDFLIENQGKIFMTHRKLKKEKLGFVKIKWPKVTRKRYTSVHPVRIYRRVMQGMYEKGINLSPNVHYWPEEYSFYKGSQWFTIPFEVAKYIVDFLDENEWFYQFYEDTLVPDESFFHTLIMNSPYESRVVNNNLFFMKWGETIRERNSPQYLTNRDIQDIEQSNQFFARKFDETIDCEVIDYFTQKITLERSRMISIGG